MVLPNLIIAGVNKGGSTSVFSYLASHPDVCASSIKETCYFLPLRYGDALPPAREYAGFFRHYRGERYILEATPGYFYGGEAVARAIKEKLGDVKVVIILRNPVDRLISFYRFKKSMMELDERLTLDDYVRACESLSDSERKERLNNRYFGIDGGFYADHLPAWLDVFGDSLRVLFFDQLKENPAKLMEDLCRWLDLDSAIYRSGELPVENKTMGFNSGLAHKLALVVNARGEKLFRSHPRMKDFARKIYYSVNGAMRREAFSPDTLAHLERVFTMHNQRAAAELLKRGYSDLPKWLA